MNNFDAPLNKPLEQSKNMIANKQDFQTILKPGLVDLNQEEPSTNLQLTLLKLRQEGSKLKIDKLILQENEITKQIEELLKQQVELDQEVEELRKQKEFENLSGKELQKYHKLKQIESYNDNDTILPTTLPPLDQHKKLHLSEVKFAKRLRRYRHILTRNFLSHYGYPVESYDEDGVFIDQQSKPREYSFYRSPCKLEHICVRCDRPFHVSEAGEYLTKESCVYHSGEFKERFTCCAGERDSEGCERYKLHVWQGIKDGYSGPYNDFLYTQPRSDKSDIEAKVYALNCKMCYTGRGLEVARVSLVGYDGQVVYDHFVKPTSEVVDYCTRFSGVTAKDLCEMQNKNLKTFAEAQKDLLQLIDADTILIGHSMENDLRVLKIVHKKVVDTAHEFPHPLRFPRRHSLKNLTKKYLKRDIQCGNNGHDSVENARACLELVMWKDVIKRIISGDESWIYAYDPETDDESAENRGRGELKLAETLQIK
ncbi:putative exonuclease GOR [Bactrocera tryoni]|uniref:putative exonuclease GOR n=1 Tax=Bactrocera tryoni TaxID=59916 RepID=UPI001A996DE4|nr:putative exonuclease GOR [Bactrocera tryoni]